MAFSPRTLQGQLTVLFLAVGLIPVLLVTGIAARQILNALDRWETPGVQRALDGSLDVAREHLEMLKNDLRQRGQLLATDPVLEPPRREGAVRDRLARSYNLDFVQLFSPDGELLFQTTRDPLISSPPLNAPPDPAVPFLEDRERGLLAYVGYAGEPGVSEWILVAGIDLGPAFYSRLDDLTQAIAYYRRLPVLITVSQRAILVGLGLFVLALAVAGAWLARRLAARISRPVAQLGAGMQRVARGEDRVRVDPEGTAEVERLIRTFNEMSAELARSRRELAQAERMSAWREVARRVAHEMKNALTPVSFSMHRLKSGIDALPESERERYAGSLATVTEEVEGLKRLAGSFSELARLPVPDLEPVDLREVVGGAAAGFAGEVAALSWEPPTDPVLVLADRTLLRQALTNLIKNAREAAGSEGRIWIGLQEDPDAVRVIVEDDGPGWSDEERARALEPYVTTKAAGTGLGLSLVERTMLQHGGALELDRRPQGGARVTLTLPTPTSRREPRGDPA